jgi:hypothetical protein
LWTWLSTRLLSKIGANKEEEMAFKVLFLAHAPDADKERHRSMIETGMYKLFSVVVKNQEEALEVCGDFLKGENIDSVLLCPGFTHSDVAEIARLAGDKVAVAVARGDGPSSRASLEARKREGYLSKRAGD